MQQAVIKWYGGHYKEIVALALAGSLASLVGLIEPGLREEYTIASFVGSDNAEFETFGEFVATFGGSELALIAVTGPSALDEEALACLHDFVPQVEKLPAVRRALSISQWPQFGRSLWIKHPLVRGVLVSHDEKTLAVILQMHTESESGDLRNRTVAELRRLVEEARTKHPTLEIILTGPYVTMLEMFDFVREDLRLFSICVAALMLGVLYLVTGCWRTALLAVGVAAAAVLCTLGLTIAAGILFLSMAIAILFAFFERTEMMLFDVSLKLGKEGKAGNEQNGCHQKSEKEEAWFGIERAAVEK